MASTQIPRLVRATLAKGTSGGKMPSVASAKGGGGGSAKSGGGGGSAGGRGSGSGNPLMAGGFDTEGGTYDSANATTPSWNVGPFHMGGDLTEGAKRVRQKMTDQQAAASSALDKLQANFTAAGNLRDGLMKTMKEDPTVLHTLMGAGLFKNGMESLAKTMNEAASEKGSNFQVDPISGRVTNKITATSRQITDEQTGEPIGGATPGTIERGEGPNGEPILIRKPGSRSSAAPQVTESPQGATPLGQAKTQAEIDKDQSVTNKNNAGPPYKIDKKEGDFLDATPQVLGAMDVMRNWSTDANGLITGPAGALASKIFGTNDASMVWNNAKNVLKQSLMIGGIPSNYSGAMTKFLDTLPQNWQNARYNKTDLAMSSSAFRAEANAKLANIEQQNNGRPYTEQNVNQLAEVGVVPPSKGWDNPMALLKAGPDALKNAPDQAIQWLADHRQMLNPAESALAKQEYGARLAAQSQGQNPDAAQPAQGGQPTAPLPQGGQAPQGAPAAPQSPAGPQVPPPAQNAGPGYQLPMPQGDQGGPPPAPPGTNTTGRPLNPHGATLPPQPGGTPNPNAGPSPYVGQAPPAVGNGAEEEIP